MKKNGSVLLYLNIWRLDTLILCLVGVLNLSEIQRQHKTFIMPSLLTSRQKNYCLRFLVNGLIIELLLQCIKWLHNSFFASASCFVGKNDLNQPGKCIHMRKFFPAWLRSRSVLDEVSVMRGNFQLIWTELFCWWKLALWRDLAEIIFPPRRHNSSHMNSS